MTLAPILLLLPTLAACAAVYHVAPDGDDGADGSEERPWKTLQHAADRVRLGDTVLVKEGTYAPVHLAARGTREAWITFRGAPGQRPKIVFDGWWGIELRATLDGDQPAYIEIEGVEIQGVTPPLRSCARQRHRREGDPQPPHRVLRNIVHGCGGCGIVMQRRDPRHIEGKIAYHTSHGPIPP